MKRKENLAAYLCCFYVNLWCPLGLLSVNIRTCDLWAHCCCCGNIRTCNLWSDFLLLWKNWNLQFGRIIVVVEILGLAIWSDCCCRGKFGTCNLLLDCWYCCVKIQIWKFGDILVGPKTHFQNLKLFSCCPVTRC